ncbi:MAG: chromosome partitioning protein ParB, partial [Deltaproteobacteria bacterium]|nr:chromosome partitioning protein ParB [Deltaproteobacteria bacterium]
QIEKIENDFKNILGTKVNIHMSGKKGKIEIHFFSIDDLNRIIDIIKSSF